MIPKKSNWLKKKLKVNDLKLVVVIIMAIYHVEFSNAIDKAAAVTGIYNRGKCGTSTVDTSKHYVQSRTWERMVPKVPNIYSNL